MTVKPAKTTVKTDKMPVKPSKTDLKWTVKTVKIDQKYITDLDDFRHFQ